MDRINSITIENYRSCLITDFDLQRPLTALIGVNGVGKTNILSAIFALKQVESKDNDIEKLKTILESNPTTIVVEISLKGKTVQVRAQFYIEFDEYHENMKYSELSYRLPRAKKWKSIEKSYFDYARFYLDESQYNVSRMIQKELFEHQSVDFELKYEIIKFLDEIAYFSATRFADPSKCPTSLELKGTRLRNGYSRNVGHQNFMADLYKANEDKHPFERFMRVVGPDGMGLVENIKFKTTMITNTTSAVLANGTIQNHENLRTIIMPSVRIDGLNLTFNQLSEGTFKTLALVFYILNSNKNVLLIEEPEVSVHYGLLASIIELIKGESKDKQIVVSTHSDYVLDKLEPENIVVVTKDRKSGTIAKTLDKAMAADDYKYLKKYLHDTGNLGEYWRESGFIDD